jgi:hypothetical protein
MRWSMQPAACVVEVPCACARFVGSEVKIAFIIARKEIM